MTHNTQQPIALKPWAWATLAQSLHLQRGELVRGAGRLSRSARQQIDQLLRLIGTEGQRAAKQGVKPTS